jgi:hypothetical protein
MLTGTQGTDAGISPALEKNTSPHRSSGHSPHFRRCHATRRWQSTSNDAGASQILPTLSATSCPGRTGRMNHAPRENAQLPVYENCGIIRVTGEVRRGSCDQTQSILSRRLR